MKGIKLLFCSVFLSALTYAQGDFKGGVLPKVNLSLKLPGNLRLTGGLESRQQFFSEESHGLAFRHEAVLTDLSFLLSARPALNQTLSGGYLMRFRNQALVHRFIQQYSIVKKERNSRLGHRIAADQTVEKDQDWTLRLRYRFSFEKPLSGESVDPREWYLKIGNEYLLSLEKGETDLEARLVPAMGYEIGKGQRAEAGLDYRFSRFLRNSPGHRFWLTASWFLSI